MNKKSILIIASVLLNSISSFGQVETWISGHQGFYFTDLIVKSKGINGEVDKDMAFYGYSYVSDVAANFIWPYNDNISFNGGVGVNIYRELNGYSDITAFGLDGRLTFHHISASFGADFFPDRRISYSALLNYYRLADNNTYFFDYLHRRYFILLDLGVKLRLNSRFKLSLYSPVTIVPFIKGKLTYGSPGYRDITIKPFAEVVGLKLGLHYKLF